MLSSVKAFDWHRQTFAHVDFEIEPGDILTTRCSYRTKKAHSDIKFGMDAATNEMCIDFLLYYPRMAGVAVCGYAGRDAGSDLMYCGGGAEKKPAGGRIYHAHGFHDD